MHFSAKRGTMGTCNCHVISFYTKTFNNTFENNPKTSDNYSAINFQKLN